jgi:hypothetical protein
MGNSLREGRKFLLLNIFGDFNIEWLAIETDLSMPTLS